MIVFDEKIGKNTMSDTFREWDSLAEKHGRDKVLMFDLETTGLSAKSAFIYIIGINLWIDDEWHILQLYNDDGQSEPAMLSRFMELLQDKTTLYHFNGDRFDIPFVRERMAKIQKSLGISIPDYTEKVKSVDFYKQICPFKTALGLPNVKQKTIEQYLGIHREDKYNGGQLIEVYLSCLSTGDKKSRDLVILHNRDDMAGMFYLAKMQGLISLAAGEFSINKMAMDQQGEQLYLTFSINLSLSLPRPLVTSDCGVLLQGEGTELSLRCPVTRGEGICQVNKEPCSGFFLPAMNFTGLPIYNLAEKKRSPFIAANDQILGDPSLLHEYVHSAVKTVMSPKAFARKSR